MSTVRPATINFRLYPDATFSEVTTLLDSNQQPVDLSARTGRLQIRRDRDDADALFTLTTENGGLSLGADGKIAIAIAAADTYPTLTPPIDRDGEAWFYDLLITDPAETPPVVDRLFQGTITVQPGVTQPA